MKILLLLKYDIYCSEILKHEPVSYCNSGPP